MARVTVEDCLENVKNRFELVILAARRTRQLTLSAKEPFVNWENDKPTVVALREIAEGFINTSNVMTQEQRPVSDTEMALNAGINEFSQQQQANLSAGLSRPNVSLSSNNSLGANPTMGSEFINHIPEPTSVAPKAPEGFVANNPVPDAAPDVNSAPDLNSDSSKD